jgi:peptide/nickel transport system permease protein
MTTSVATAGVVTLQRAAPRRGQLALVWGQFRRNRGALLGAFVALTLIALALFSHWIAPYDPLATNPPDRLQGPSWSHLMGTDKFGRDLFSRIVVGAPESLKVGFLAILVGDWSLATIVAGSAPGS